MGAERIGILGGTFDPVHVGHLFAAVAARDVLGLDRVLLVVANEPWQKVGARSVTPARARLAVVEAAIDGVEGLEASQIEIDRGGPSYTADTIAELRTRHPGAELVLVVGSDIVPELGTWHRVDELRHQVVLAVVDRAGDAGRPDPPGWQVRRVPIPMLEVSSSELRERLATGRPVDFLIPADAIRCIRAQGLYALGR
jgi:nicotinate-nucleotide adenylyltransferase